MNTAWAKATLGDFEAPARPKDHVFLRYAHVGEAHVAVAMGCVIVAEDVLHLQDFDPRGIPRHENLRLPCVLRCIRFGDGT